MRRVFKYELDILDGPQAVEMPRGSKILHVDSPAPGTIWMWAIVVEGQPNVVRHFQVVGTGHESPAGIQYVGTTTPYPLVWHVFEVGS